MINVDVSVKTHTNIVCKKYFIWNPTTCRCENLPYYITNNKWLEVLNMECNDELKEIDIKNLSYSQNSQSHKILFFDEIIIRWKIIQKYFSL